MNYTQRRGVSGDPGQHGWREEQSLEKDVLHALLEILELEVDDYEDNDDMSRIRSRFKGNLCPPAAQKKCRVYLETFRLCISFLLLFSTHVATAVALCAISYIMALRCFFGCGRGRVSPP